MMTTKIWVQLYKDLIAHDNRPRARTRRAVHAAGHNGLVHRPSTALLYHRLKIEGRADRKQEVR